MNKESIDKADIPELTDYIENCYYFDSIDWNDKRHRPLVLSCIKILKSIDRKRCDILVKNEDWAYLKLLCLLDRRDSFDSFLSL